MAKVRFIGPEPVSVPELDPSRFVQPDEVVDVPDERFDGYVCQPANWEVVQPPKGNESAAEAESAQKTLAKKTAAKSAPQKEG